VATNRSNFKHTNAVLLCVRSGQNVTTFTSVEHFSLSKKVRNINCFFAVRLGIELVNVFRRNFNVQYTGKVLSYANSFILLKNFLRLPSGVGSITQAFPKWKVRV